MPDSIGRPPTYWSDVLTTRSPRPALHCIINLKNDIILDPTLKQENALDASLMFVLAKAWGDFSSGQYLKCLFACQTATEDVFSIY